MDPGMSLRGTRAKGVLHWALACALLATASLFACTVDDVLDGKPCGPDGECAPGYECVQEPCGDGYLCSVCRANPQPPDDGGGEPDAGTDGGDEVGGDGDGGDGEADGSPPCDPVPPPCKLLPDCTDTPPECVDGTWVCDTGFEIAETRCDGLDNDCDGSIDEALVCTLAGDGTAGFADGEAAAARFSEPRGLCAHPSGGVVVGDRANHAIRLVAADGSTSTLAGTGEPGADEGPGDQARFHEPCGVCPALDGAVLVADSGNHRIRRIDALGEVSCLAGSGFTGFLDGPAEQARFTLPEGVAASADGRVFVADTGNDCIRLVSGGQVSTWAGQCQSPGTADGDRATAQFHGPTDLLLLEDGALLVSEQGSHRIRLVSADGELVSTLAGSGVYDDLDGPLATAAFKRPAGLLAEAGGLSYLAADYGNRIRRIDPAGDQVSTAIGSGEPGFVSGPPESARFLHPSGLARLGDGRLVIADTHNHALRVVNP
ncbi:MAG: hypothetical protein JXR96_07060 [Deltaproteobacteria bacterium]|nr:hypothetical protein [Deltaproteobacteria bacterium]